ncbi:MgtC/SapB family protein [Tepidimicrobium xylanilyticum]|uniref:Putative Mg2+ transporter-C (MgtC) family protein n=1 Tax=Tepidimicrobium xylanilyticum TaxID=1123352 RepID=A0A1H2YCK0_9FIRM|nr:MgtC/SapB family protein [Tepidimicrobium xylanilyticum]GMG97101.1 magnesium transporter MgtC [Tepidimicrobium xylanilyticum]SDX02695.1 putative Mg2+ transporter-C (MgtC) family protein [Tepidimicrobium xylanilyticum]
MLDNKQVVIRMLLSILLSGFIGIDRESTKKPAGLRTHILVSLGSTLIMLLSIYMNTYYHDTPSYYSDRIAAQVISGIGFLGAGTILRRDTGAVTGLTTAASLWVVAAIGLAVGAGFYIGAIIATLLVMVTLMSFHRFGRGLQRRFVPFISLSILTTDKPGQIGKIGKILGEYDSSIFNIEIEHKDDRLVRINIDTRIKDSNIKYEILNSLASIDGILEVSEGIKKGE